MLAPDRATWPGTRTAVGPTSQTPDAAAVTTRWWGVSREDNGRSAGTTLLEKLREGDDARVMLSLSEDARHEDFSG